MTTLTNRQNDSATSFLANNAYAGGVDYDWRLSPRYNVTGYWAASRIEGSTEAITRLQENTVHGFQRPGADYVDVDEAATTLSGHAGSLSVGKIAGENAPFHKIPNGIPGLAARLPILFTEGVSKGRIDVQTFVRLVSTNPARLFGLHPRKGTIAVGSDADIVIFDQNEEMTISAKTHHMRVDYSCYEGVKVKGVTKTVLSRGEVVIEEGEYVGRRGHGSFLKRGLAFSPR